MKIINSDVEQIFLLKIKNSKSFPDDRKPWTQFGWNQWRNPPEKRQFLTQMANAYNTARQGEQMKWYHYEDAKTNIFKESPYSNIRR